MIARVHSGTSPLRLALTCLLVPALYACGDASAQDPIEITSEMLPCRSDVVVAGEPWESAPWPPGSTGTCEWFAYDGGKSYRITHDLGRVPRSILVYISFDSDGRSSTVSHGDPTRIVSATDTIVEIRNGTAQDFYAKLVLE